MKLMFTQCYDGYLLLVLCIYFGLSCVFTLRHEKDFHAIIPQKIDHGDR